MNFYTILKGTDELLMKQEKVKFYNSVKDGKYKLSNRTEIGIEQEIIKQHEKQLSDERAKEYQKTPKRLKKESEERRKKQRDNNKIAGRGSALILP